MKVVIDGYSLTLDDLVNVARHHYTVSLADNARENIINSRQRIEHILANNQVVYGINTGFGKLANVVINPCELSQLQQNLLMSHACGVGAIFSPEITRAMMLLRINALAKGFSGIRLETIELLMTLLNKNILPVIPEQGSLGASGDLAPLSHMALPLLGLGEVVYQGERMPAQKAMELAGIEPLSHLEAKEGLSLINGTQAMTAVGALTLAAALNLSKQLDIAGSLTMEALYGIIDAMDERIHNVRGQVGQINTARNMIKITEKSTYITRQGEKRVQDAYSLRCIPQVHGAIKDALEYVKEKVEIEINAATDNPLVFDENTVISGGNFHGEPMALAFDFLKIALSEMANISERRLERLVNPQLSEGLPAFLVKNSGVNSGFMIVQYAAAALVSENKVLAHPASVDSIPSSANQEDHVSMGTIAARGARDILKNVQAVIAMEMLAACQAIDLREPKTLGRGTKAAYDVIRENVAFIDQDVIMYPYIEKVKVLVEEEKILQSVERVVGELS